MCLLNPRHYYKCFTYINLFDPHFTDGDTEAQRNELTCLRSQMVRRRAGIPILVACLENPYSFKHSAIFH